MSRLESAIRRLQAQRIALDWAAENIGGQQGFVLEFGLGNGRTLDHIRQLLPDRDIYVFERKIAAHPDCIPDVAFQFIGDFFDCLPRAIEQLGRRAILAHLDIGTGEKNNSLTLAREIAPFVEKLLLPKAIIISDQEVQRWVLKKLPLPAGIAQDKIYIYRL